MFSMRRILPQRHEPRKLNRKRKATTRMRNAEATKKRRGWWRRLTGLLTRQARTAGCESKDVRGGSTPTRWLGDGLHVLQIEPTPLLAEPFASLLDFDALEREAEQARQGGTGPQKTRREPKGLRPFLKPDVTRTEGLLLTAELSRLGPCLVARPARCGSDRQGTDATLLRLHLTAWGLDVRFA